MQREKSLPGTGNALHDREMAWRWDLGSDLWGSMLYYAEFDGDDHDHCSFCGRRICREGSPYGDGAHEGFKTMDSSWVCLECYGLMRDAMGLRLYDPAAWNGSDLYCFLRAAISWRKPLYREWDVSQLFASLADIGEGLPEVFHKNCRVIPVARTYHDDGSWTDTHLVPLAMEIPPLRLEDVPGLWDLLRPHVEKAGYPGEFLIEFFVRY